MQVICVNSHTNFINDAMKVIDIHIKTLGSHAASALSSNVWNVSFLNSAMFTEDPIDKLFDWKHPVSIFHNKIKTFVLQEMETQRQSCITTSHFKQKQHMQMPLKSLSSQWQWTLVSGDDAFLPSTYYKVIYGRDNSVLKPDFLLTLRRFTSSLKTLAFLLFVLIKCSIIQTKWSLP